MWNLFFIYYYQFVKMFLTNLYLFQYLFHISLIKFEASLMINSYYLLHFLFLLLIVVSLQCYGLQNHCNRRKVFIKWISIISRILRIHNHTCIISIYSQSLIIITWWFGFSNIYCFTAIINYVIEIWKLNWNIVDNILFYWTTDSIKFRIFLFARTLRWSFSQITTT